MQRTCHLLTSLTFAAHAMLGCGVHAACPALSGPVEHVRHSCSHHDEAADHSAGSKAPADSQLPAHRCEHLACSFVKANTMRIDCGERVMQSVASVVHAACIFPTTMSRGDCETICQLASKPAHLFVWHCALLI